MSEKLHHNHEHLSEADSAPEDHNRLASLHEKAEKDKAEHQDPEKLRVIQEQVEKESVEKETTKVGDTPENTNHSSIFINKELKSIAFERSMTRVRKKLSYPNKVLSRVIHNPTVDKISEVTGKTVARPLSTLIASITAFVASGALLIISNRYGYQYNYLVLILTFVGGYFIGLVIELVLTFLTRNNKLRS